MITLIISFADTVRAEDYNSLVGKNMELKEKLDSVISDYEGLKKRYRLLLEKIKSLQDERKQLIKSKEKLWFDLITKDKQIKELKAQLKALNNRVNNIEKGLQNNTVAGDGGNTDNTSQQNYKEELLQLKKDLIKAIEEQTGSSLEKSMLEDIIKELKTIINKQKREAEELQSKLKDEYLNKEKELMENTHKLEEELLNAKANRIEIEQKLKTAQEKNNTLQEQLTALKEEITAHKKSGKWAKTEKEIQEEVRHTIRQEFERKERQLKAQIEELTEKVMDIETNRKKIEDRLKTAKKALKQAESEKDKLERQIEIVREDTKKKVQDKCLEHEEVLSARIESLKKQNLVLEDERDRQEQKLHLAEKKLTEKEQQIQQIQTEKQQLTEQNKILAEKIKALKNNIKILQNKIDIATEKRQQIEDKLSLVEKQKQKIEDELKFVRNGVERQETEIRKQRERIQQQQEQSNKIQTDLEDRLETAQARITELEAELKKQYTEAKHQIAKIKQLEKEKIRLKEEADAALYAQKAAEMKKNVLEEKIKDIKQQTNKERLDMHYNLAVVYGKNGMYKDAEREYLKCLKIDPNDAGVHYNLAILYDDKLQENQKAIEHYKKFLELRPDSELATQVSQWMLNAEQEIRLDIGPKHQ